jgi:hypothetical protein
MRSPSHSIEPLSALARARVKIVLGFLKEAEAGMPVRELCRKHGFSDAAFYGGRSKFGGLQVNVAKRLRELESENTKPDDVPSGVAACYKLAVGVSG